jgi:hypothetical protein
MSAPQRAPGSPLHRTFAVWSLTLTSCSVLNDKEVCDDARPDETIVNQQQDGNELIQHPQSLAESADGNLLLVFTGQSIEQLPSGFPQRTSVRLARFEKNGGAQRTVCTASLRDRDISEPDTYAHGGSITAVDLDVNGTRAAALVAWTENVYPEAHLRMRFVDVAGCPLGAGSFDPLGAPMRVASVAWSAAQNAVFALVDDASRLSALWISGPGTAERIPVVDQRRITSIPVLSIGPDGGIFAAWSEKDRGVRYLVIDANGAVGPESDSGIPALYYPDGKGSISVALAASTDRVAIVADASLEAGPEASTAVYAREFTRAGQPIGAAFRVDDSPARQLWPTAAYLPAGSLLVAWESESGTQARLFRDGGSARFSSITCDEAPFSVGLRSDKLAPSPVSAFVGEQAWIFHSAPDPRGVGVWLWHMPFAELWPGNQ